MTDSNSSSPWDEPIFPPPVDGAVPVPDYPPNYEPPSFEEETEIWRTRAHQLWLAAESSGDLRAAAQALSVAFRGLRDRQSALEEDNRAKSLRAELPEGQHVATIEALDGIVRKALEYARDHGWCCACCGRPLEAPIENNGAGAGENNVPLNKI